VRDSVLRHQVTVRRGAYLPHWTHSGASYAVCFRLADSLPQSVVTKWQRERGALLAEAGDRVPSPGVQDCLRELFSERVERFLDNGYGACWLRQPAIASLVADALRHFDNQHYTLHAWCVMPNHVHAVVQPLGGHTLAAILKSWKGFTGKDANRRLVRAGKFWQAEYYDHLIRDASDFAHSVRYVLENPSRAGMRDWPWVWASDEARAVARVS
jgi:REP element-mobilizing transposase RayT